MTERPPVDHPLVRTHPETGAKTLYIGNHASHIQGLPEAEGDTLLQELLDHATQPQFVYQHTWRVGDLVIWDNRCLLHRALANYEMAAHRRVLAPDRRDGDGAVSNILLDQPRDDPGGAAAEIGPAGDRAAVEVEDMICPSVFCSARPSCPSPKNAPA